MPNSALAVSAGLSSVTLMVDDVLLVSAGHFAGWFDCSSPAFRLSPVPIPSLDFFRAASSAFFAFACRSSSVSFFSTNKIAVPRCPGPRAAQPKRCHNEQRSHVAFHWTTMLMSVRSIP